MTVRPAGRSRTCPLAVAGGHSGRGWCAATRRLSCARNCGRALGPEAGQLRDKPGGATRLCISRAEASEGSWTDEKKAASRPPREGDAPVPRPAPRRQKPKCSPRGFGPRITAVAATKS